MVNILIVNCGSSSQSVRIFEVNGESVSVLANGKARNVATRTVAEPVIEWSFNGQKKEYPTPLPSHSDAAEKIIQILTSNQIQIDAVGHRFVHGGNIFSRSVKIEPATMEKLTACLPFAPIHNPNSFSVIEKYLKHMPATPQYAVFDTSFHSSMPEVSQQYALPRSLVEKYGYRKYGFHGLSYQYICSRIPALTGKPLKTIRLIICHLGTGGSSIAAIDHGQPLDTSMGYSPLPGLVMSTRCGDIDAEIVLDLIRKGYTTNEVSDILNNQSGLIGISGISSNLAEIIEEAEKGDPACQLAYDVYVQRLKMYIGAYSCLLDGTDMLVFTDDIGLKSWKLREIVASHTTSLGFEIDTLKNKDTLGDTAAKISASSSKAEIWVIPTDEEFVILQEVLALL